MKKVLAKALLFIFAFQFLCLDYTDGQVYNLNSYLTLPSVVPSSPNAASIEKFGNIPVDYSTGVPGIGIPVWEIKCGLIDWPLSLSYHSAGIKVDEIASCVGLGWALTGPGVISRSVIGKPDEQWQNNPIYTSITTNNYDYLYAVNNGQNDNEPDIFSYNFNGRAGKFLIQQDGSVFMMPYTNLKITNNDFNSFTILDENGSTYTFDQKETVNSDANGIFSTYTSSWYLSKVQPLNKVQSIEFIYGNPGQSTQTYYNFSQSIGVRPSAPPRNCGTPVNVESFSSQPTFGRTNTTATTLQLTQINFPNGYISFNYRNDRLDLAGSPNYRLIDIAIYQLGTAKLIKKFSLKQSYFFYRPPSITGDDPSQYRLRLDEVDEIASDLSALKPYKFEYNSTPMVPRGSYGQDKWGFNNGHYENTSLIQSQTVNYSNGNSYNVGNANRTTDVSQMQSCMLNSVTYPTGGKTVYTFEPHQYLTNFTSTTTTTFAASADGASTSSQHGSGSFTFPSSGASNGRIKVHLSSYNFPSVSDRPYVKLTDLSSGNSVVYNLANFTPDNSVQTDNSFFFTPGHNYNTEAFVFTSLSNTQLQAQIIVQWDIGSGTSTTESGGGFRIREIKNYVNPNSIGSDIVYEYPLATPLTPITYINQTFNDVIYRIGLSSCDAGQHDVCDYFQSGTCRVYHSASVYPVSTISGSPFLYNTVAKYSKDYNGSDAGKSIFNYDIIQDQELPVGGPSVFNAHLYSNDWKNGFLISQFNYKETATTGLPPSYQLISKTENEYQEVKLSTTYTLKVYPNFIHSGCQYQGPSYVSSDINYFAFPIRTGSKKLVKSITTALDDKGGQIATVTTNEYAGLTNDFVTKTTTTDSKGVNKILITKYPADFASPGNVYATMLERNLVSPVIQQQSLSGSSILSTEHKSFKDWNGDGKVIAPEIIQIATLDNPLENRVQYFAYDLLGNALSEAKINNAVQSYLYDYQNSYPIAEVQNAMVGDIAYTSFESDGAGGWAIPSNTPNTVTAFTGKSSYDFVNGSISKSGLTVGKTYLLSYWSHDGAFVVSGGLSAVVAGAVVNGWTYFIHKITATDSTLRVNGTAGLIDELRLIPFDAQMTTFTYEPLIGQVATSDINARPTYYEYDGFCRLKNIKDFQGNIVKNFQYNYSNSCGSNCVVLTMQTFTGYNTPSYPVGVFNGNKQYLGLATSPGQYVTIWNGNAANQGIGVLSIGGDSLHFNLTLANTASVPPVVYGLRFYQWDVFSPTNVQIGTDSLSFVDWGDGVKELAAQSRRVYYDTDIFGYSQIASIIHHDPLFRTNVLSHNYNTTQPRTITVFHNETTEYISILNDGIDYTTQDANIRGYFPEKVKGIGYTSLNNSSDVNVNNIGKLTELVFLDYLFPAETSITKHNNFQSYNNSHKLQWIKMHYKNGLEVVSDIKNNFPNLKIMELFGYKVDNLVSWSNGGLKNAYVILMVPPSGEVIATTEIDAMITGQAAAGVVNGYFGFIPNPTRSVSTTAAFNTLAARGWYLGEIISPQ